MRKGKQILSIHNSVYPQSCLCAIVSFRTRNEEKSHTKRIYKTLTNNKQNKTPLFYPLLLLLFISFSCTNKKSNPNQANNDSINKYLQLASNNTIPFPERDKYNQKAFSLIDLSRNDSVVRRYLNESALNFSRTKNELKYYKISNIHFDKSKEAKDTLNLARFYRYRAGYHKNKTKLFDSAFYYYIKAERFYKKTKDYKGLAYVCFNKGDIQNSLDDYLGADFSANQSYLIAKKLNNNIKYDVLTSLGNIAHNLKNYKNAIKYHRAALKIAKEKNLKSKIYKINFVGTSLNNIGNTYRELKKHRMALFYFNEAKKDEEKRKIDPEIIGFLNNNIGYCKMQLNDYNQLPYLFEKAAKIFDSLGIKNECAISNVYLSDYYIKIKDTLKAISYSEKALQLAKESKAPYYYLTALSNAGFVNKNKASQYIKEYHKKNDSLQFEERKARNQFFKIQLETDQITQEKETAIKQKWVIASIISSVLLIVILLFVIHKQRAKQKELQLLQTQQKSNEEIYQLMLNQQAKVEEARQIEKKRIALELHDGIMNKLASTRLNLFVLSKKNDKETINNCLTYIEDIHDIENEIRNVSHDLNQELFLEKDSFKMLLKQFVKEQNSHNTTNYELQIAENVNWELVSSQIKMHLYRIIQEASHNINKYAKATQADISFIIEDNKLNLSITDNGSGFDTTKTKEGIGLQNMQQRSQAINSVFSIESNNKGTKLQFKIPMV